MNLANELLPPLPQGTISLPVSSSFFMKGSLPKKGHAGSSSKSEDSNGKIQEVSNREKLLNDQPELLQHFGMDLLPVLVQVGCQRSLFFFCLLSLSLQIFKTYTIFRMQIYGSSVNGPVRHKCLSVIGKLMYFSSAELIQSLNNDTNISRYMALPHHTGLSFF